MHYLKAKLFVLYLFISFISFGQKVKSYNTLENKVTVNFSEGNLHIIPLNDNAVRIQFTKEKVRELPELVFTVKHKTPDFKVKETDNYIILTTANIKVLLDKESGVLTYFDENDNLLLQEKSGSRILQQSTVQDENCFITAQTFESPQDEYLYGLGQFQDGYLNIKNLPRRLTQVNTQISIPFVMSNKGYGLLWHNYGLTDFNPLKNAIKLSSAGAVGDAKTIDVTTSEGTQKQKRQNGTFNQTLDIKEDGKYALMLDVGSKMAKNWNLKIDGKEVINLRNHWLPPTVSTIIPLKKGKHNVVVQSGVEDNPVLYYDKINNETTFKSPVANKLDYVVFSGDADQVISSYRNLTGKAPMIPKWALGYIHCRERFNNQNELLENAREFRERNLPLDLIVQDWMYWGKYGWNAMQFDEENYPDPAQMVNELHGMDIRLMVSVWSKISRGSNVGKQFYANKYIIQNTNWIDFFNPDAADLYWKNFSSNLLKPYQIDAWWQDATEPENDDLVGRKINNNTTPGGFFRNVYPLYVTKTVYEGLRQDAPDKRIFILTRSGFSGQQRYGAATWSGDIGNDWQTMKKQLTAGLNYSITGLPWWTFDAGGFFRPRKDQYTDVDFHERYIRWLQLATFSPLQRAHGYKTNTEFWRYGKSVETLAKKYLDLRYELMPYIYSEAAKVSFKNSTIMRPLIMDFVSDEKALQQNYEYMFGSAFLVAPVLDKNTFSKEVYLPKNKGGWYNFWTNDHFKGGNNVTVNSDIQTIPLFIKAGSIVPLGKPIQNTSESQAENITLNVYTGADAFFELYEDEGTNYNYEKGEYSIIPVTWNETNKALTIGKQNGTFNGYLKERIFNVVWIDESGKRGTEKVVVNYKGKTENIKLRP